MAEPATTVEYDETATAWHILVVTRGGKVSILKNLDAPTARQAYRSLKPDSRPVEFNNWPENGSWQSSGGFRPSSDGDIVRVEILGPEGAELDPWRGVEPRVIDLAGQEVFCA